MERIFYVEEQFKWIFQKLIMNILLEYSEMEWISKWISNTSRNEGWIFKRIIKIWMNIQLNIYLNIQRHLKWQWIFKFKMNIHCHFKWRWIYITLVIQAIHEYSYEYSSGYDPQMYVSYSWVNVLQLSLSRECLNFSCEGFEIRRQSERESVILRLYQRV